MMKYFIKELNDKFDVHERANGWKKYRACLNISSQLFGQVEKIAYRYNLKVWELANKIALLGYDHIKNWDVDEIINEGMRIKTMKYTLKKDIALYSKILPKHFFEFSDELVDQGSSFSHLFALCVKYGLKYIQNIGVDDYFNNMHWAEFHSLRRRFRNEYGDVDTELVKDPTINISGIGLFDE